jgi:hypothetical protein
MVAAGVCKNRRMSMDQENGKTGKPVEMYRVRRIVDGMYLIAETKEGRGEFNLRWWHPMQSNVFKSEWSRKAAAVIAAAMMLLTGDHGIEIEPVE